MPRIVRFHKTGGLEVLGNSDGTVHCRSSESRSFCFASLSGSENALENPCNFEPRVESPFLPVRLRNRRHENFGSHCFSALSISSTKLRIWSRVQTAAVRGSS